MYECMVLLVETNDLEFFLKMFPFQPKFWEIFGFLFDFLLKFNLFFYLGEFLPKNVLCHKNDF